MGSGLLSPANQLTNTNKDIRRFLDGTQNFVFSVADGKLERYQRIQQTLVKHKYILLSKADKVAVTRFIMKVSRYSRAQTKRLIHQYIKSDLIRFKRARRNGFERTFIDRDIRLLARMDELHNRPSGGVLKKLCERAYR